MKPLQIETEVWLTVTEAAAIASLNPVTIHRWIRSGKIVRVRGRRGSTRVLLADVLPLQVRKNTQECRREGAREPGGGEITKPPARVASVVG
jgi:hypothetical protein